MPRIKATTIVQFCEYCSDLVVIFLALSFSLVDGLNKLKFALPQNNKINIK